jgi:outer membrane protein assembly factor BamA
LTVHTGLLFELANVLQQEDHLVNELQPYGLGTLDFLALSTLFRYDNRDDKESPYTGYYFDAYAEIYTPTLNNKDFFGKITLDGRTYLTLKYFTDLTLALRHTVKLPG